jgi:nucleotide-binding universal stress UspA family protein
MTANFKILLATDYSETVKNAEHYALQFAKATGSKLSLINSYYVPFIGSRIEYEEMTMLDDIAKAEDLKIKSHVQQMLSANKVNPDQINFDYKAVRGQFPTVLFEEAKERDCDFIVIGTHGTKGKTDRLFGNHAWEILKNAPVPVLVIPDDAFFTGWKKIVFATEYRAGEIPGIRFLAGIADAFNAELIIAHVSKTMLTGKAEEMLLSEFRKDVLETVPYQNITFRVFQDESVERQLDEYCKMSGADILIVSHEKKNFLDKFFDAGISVTKRMSFQTRLPLLVVPDYYKTDRATFWKMFDVYDYEQGDY